MIGWIWSVSSTIYPERGTVSFLRRIRFLIASLNLHRSLRSFFYADPRSSLAKLIERRPETIGAVVWPYQSSEWNAPERMVRIRDHCAIIDSMGGAIDFSVDEELFVLDLSAIREDLRVIADQPKWFMREGLLALNLFLGNVRIYTLAFSFCYQDGEKAVFVGAIQGRDIEGALELYKELTKASHGMRPRDLLIEIFGMFCAKLGFRRIFAVSDELRIHRSPYFGKNKVLSLNYNEIWEDRQGNRVNETVYELKLDSRRRNLDEVPAKKRSMYRKRYDMLDHFQEMLKADAQDAKPV
jgi:uncharacterized protein VirK/YbjX